MTYTPRCPHGWLDSKDCATCELLKEVTTLRNAYIEASKEPPREWVGLTEAEVTSLMYDCNALPECEPTDSTMQAFVRAVEARLKKLNYDGL